MTKSSMAFRQPTVFISASHDMRQEAEIVAAVVETLSATHPSLRDLECFRWFDSDTPWRADSTWQEQIPDPADPMVVAVVCLFGARLGQPLPDVWPGSASLVLPLEIAFPWREGMAGKIPLTGTLYEYLRARSGSAASHARDRSPLLVYCLGDSGLAMSDLPADQRNWGLGRHFEAVCASQRREDFAEYFQQIDWLTLFFDQVHRPRERPCNFIDGNPDQFRQIVSRDLEKQFGLNVDVALIPALKGLESYDVGDNRIFAGRGRFVGKVVRDIRKHTPGEPLAAIVIGGSGAGKSSVLRAGIVAELQLERHADPCRYRVLLRTPRLPEGRPPIASLGRDLAETALPELGRPDDIAAILTAHDGDPVELLLDRIVEALPYAAKDAKPAQLIIAIDQLDDFVHDGPGASPAPSAEAFIRFLVTGARRGVFWLLGSLADVRLAEWNRLLGADAALFDLLHLGNPSWEELNEIIEVSFRALNVTLPEELRDTLIATCRELDSTGTATLPLLSIAMTQLGAALAKLENASKSGSGERRAGPGSSLVRLATKHADVRKSINDVAEQAMAMAAQHEDWHPPSSLGPIFCKLVAVSTNAARDVVTLVSHIPQEDDVRMFGPLVKALIQRRILVPAEEGGIRFAHEAVIRHWKRATEWFDLAHEHLAFVETIRPIATRWESATDERRHAYLLPAGYCLDAYELMIGWSGETSDLPIGFIRASLIANAADLVDYVGTEGRTPLMAAAARDELDLLSALLVAGADTAVRDARGATALHHAANGRVIERLLANGPIDLDVRSAGRRSAIERAAERERWDVVVALLAAGASPNEAPHPAAKQDALARPKSDVLRMAASAGKIDIVRTLIDRHAVASSANALTAACQCDHREIVDLLIDAGATAPPDEDNEYNDPLASAASAGHAEMVALVLRRGIVAGPASLGRSLINAAAKGYQEIVAQLIAAGASAEYTDASGLNALAEAVLHGHVATVGVLIQAGADLAWRSRSGRTLLHVAAQAENLALLEWLSPLFEDKVPRDADGRTPFHIAIVAGRNELVDWLIEQGADPLDRDRFGFNALALAADAGAYAIIEKLAGLGLSLVEDSIAPSALEMSANRGELDMLAPLLPAAQVQRALDPAFLVKAALGRNPETVTQILALGVDVDQRDTHGLTALMYAAWMANAEMAEALLQAGADPTAIGPDGWTALMFLAASECQDDEAFERIAIELVAYGSDVHARNNAEKNAADIAGLYGTALAPFILLAIEPANGAAASGGEAQR